MNYKKFLGTASAALMIIIIVILVLSPGACAQSKYKTLHRFRKPVEDGAYPAAGLIFDTAATGSNPAISPDGKLLAFFSQSVTNLEAPKIALVRCSVTSESGRGEPSPWFLVR
jgi:hypothetical protein